LRAEASAAAGLLSGSAASVAPVLSVLVTADEWLYLEEEIGSSFAPGQKDADSEAASWLIR
jgi:hypothetical protein